MRDIVVCLFSIFALGFNIFCLYNLIKSAFIKVNLEALPRCISYYFLSELLISVSKWLIKGLI